MGGNSCQGLCDISEPQEAKKARPEAAQRPMML